MLKRCSLLLCLVFILIGCGTSQNNKDPNLPKMPYQEWRLGGVYPYYFQSTVFQVSIMTQSNEWRGGRIIASANSTEPEWNTKYLGRGDYAFEYDLPATFSICWASFADQTFYKTKLEVPLWAREEMVKPHQYYSHVYNKQREGYYNQIIIGFAPGGNVTGWLATDVPDLPAIEFGQGVTQKIPQGSDVCPNPYPNGKITEISDEAKAWLKKHGMPKAWREENNNITIGPDIRISPLPVLRD